MQTTDFLRQHLDSTNRSARAASDSSQDKAAIHDARASTSQLRQLQSAIDASPRVAALNTMTQLMNREQPINGLQAAPVRSSNRSGLPDDLKSGIETLSGVSMDHVKVHYDSSQPAQLNALAYAQGNDIHLAPGQERHLPHEAWHVVQQHRGNVKPTVEVQGVGVNDDAALEREADTMGTRALQMRTAVLSNGPAPAQRRAPAPVFQLAQEANPATVSRDYTSNADGTSNVVDAQVRSTSDGGAPSCIPEGWSDVLAKAAKVKGSWVRFHLLNQNLGGAGSRKDNLVPTSVAANHNGTWKAMEQEAQGVAAGNQWVWWRTEVTYHPANAGAGHGIGFPSKINVQSKKWNGNAWIDLTAGNGNYDLTLTAPQFGAGQVQRYFHEITGAQWQNVVGVTNNNLIAALVRHSADIKDLDDLSTQVFYSERYNFQDLDSQIENIDDAVRGNNPDLKILLEE
jgi:hypothetical protein